MVPRPGNARKALIRLGAIAFGFFAVLGSGLALAGMFAERTLPDATFAPFSGWQLYALTSVFGITLLALLVISVVALARRYRGLRGQTPHRRAVVLAALVPGAFLGGLVGNPMASAVSWASNQTMAAHHARIAARQLLAEDGKAPPVLVTGAAAPEALAARLVQRSDLGPHWYDRQRPNPSEAAVSPTAYRFGALQAIRAQFDQAHWTGIAWLPQHVIVENMLRFRSAAAARRYFANVFVKPATTLVQVGSVTVYEGGLGSKSALRTAEFPVGTDLFATSINVMSDGTPTTQDFAAIVSAAVGRATALDGKDLVTAR